MSTDEENRDKGGNVEGLKSGSVVGGIFFVGVVVVVVVIMFFTAMAVVVIISMLVGVIVLFIVRMIMIVIVVVVVAVSALFGGGTVLVVVAVAVAVVVSITFVMLLGIEAYVILLLRHLVPKNSVNFENLLYNTKVKILVLYYFIKNYLVKFIKIKNNM